MNYPYFVEQGYAIDARLEDAADGDNNFRFTGSPETYAITANGVDKTIALN
ncbi:MAG: hypothetical protein H6557_15550 [Lewinellaceae bacterium]|nr:hypothetical protein [Phaeodactylibacter sp.]MCB9038031.1 hypothetical protein [Lewinellaceae bacterium]